MRVTEKGQVTIPKPIRDKLGIGPGSEVEFVERDDAVEIVRLDSSSRSRMTPSDVDRHIAAMRGTIDTMGLDGKSFVDWLRGPRDDAVDVD